MTSPTSRWTTSRTRPSKSMKTPTSVLGRLSVTHRHIVMKMWTPECCHSEHTNQPLPTILNLVKCFSDKVIVNTTMVRLSFEKFKMCAETIEFRRRAIQRRRRFARQLKVVSSTLARRKRDIHHNRLSLNKIARIMETQVRKGDEADNKLFGKYIDYYDEQIQQTLQVLKDAANKVDHIFARVKGTFKFTMWVAACRDFMKRIRTTIQMSGPWVHQSEVVRRLYITLSQMESYQTTTQAYWQQVEVKQMLRDTMNKLFWA